MKVLQLGKYYHPYRGGIEQHVRMLASELSAEHEVEVVVANTERRTVRERVDGIPVTRCAAVAKVSSVSVCPGMAWELSRRKYDVIHLQMPDPMGAVSYLASRKPRGHKLVVTYHSDVVRQRYTKWAYERVLRTVLERADLILATSPNYVESSEVLRDFAGKCEVVPLGIDTASLALTPAVERVREDFRKKLGPGPYLLCVGRLTYYKGIAYAIDALPSVEGQLIVAGDGPERARLEEQARRRGVESRVHFLGSVGDDELTALYRLADVFVFPSCERSEAFGIVQLEAMACGVPVVNTSLASGVPWVSRDGESGLTVPPDDSGALAKALQRLLGSEELRKKLGEGGRSRVELDFRVPAMGERVRAAYRRLEGGHRARGAA